MFFLAGSKQLNSKEESFDEVVLKVVQTKTENFFNDSLKQSCWGECFSAQIVIMLTYADDDIINSIVQHERFQLKFLITCLKTLRRQEREVLTVSSLNDTGKLCLWKAAKNKVLLKIQNICSNVNDEVLNHRYSSNDKEFKPELLEVFKTERENLLVLSKCLLYLPDIKKQFSLLYCQYEIWNFKSEKTFRNDNIKKILKLMLKSFNNDKYLLMSYVELLSAIYEHFKESKLDAQYPMLPPEFDEKRTKTIFDDKSSLLGCNLRLSVIFHSIFTESHSSCEAADIFTPRVLKAFKSLVIEICRNEYFTSYIRIPPSIWKFGWSCRIIEDHKFDAGEIPTDYLQENDVLISYISILNSIGWSNRQQFEEIWTKMLGVLVSQQSLINPQQNGQQSSGDYGEGEETTEACQTSCLSVRAMTSLIMSCSLAPQAGHPDASRHQVEHRVSGGNKVRVAMSTKSSRQLLKVINLLNHQTTFKSRDSCHGDPDFTPANHKQLPNEIQYENSEFLSKYLREPRRNVYNFGQISADFFRSNHNLQDDYDSGDIVSFTSDSENVSIHTGGMDDYDETSSSSDISDVFEEQLKIQQKQLKIEHQKTIQSASANQKSSIVDVHSCVQFMLDLIGEWIGVVTQQLDVVTSQNRRVTCEYLRCLLMMSDLFTMKQQFEWLFIQCAELINSSIIKEDELIEQYLCLLLCKSATLLGLRSEMVDLVNTCIENLLSPAKLGTCHAVGLYSFLYLLQHPTNLHSTFSYMSNYIIVVFQQLNMEETEGDVELNEELKVVAVTCAVEMIQISNTVTSPANNQQLVVTSYFINTVLQTFITLVSSDQTSCRLYDATMQGLHKLITSFALSHNHCESAFKSCGLELLSDVSQSEKRMKASLHVVLISMYCGQIRTNSNSSQDSTEMLDVVETRLLAMERVSVLFERIRKGTVYEAKLICRLLAVCINDFISKQDVINKIIAEFLSSVQPHSNMLAYLLFEIFQLLHNKEDCIVIREWVLLSLGNAIRRQPVNTSVWCLTILFASSSNNHFIVSLISKIISREKKFGQSEEDHEIFCACALDFYTNQLDCELDRKSFQSVFCQAVNTLKKNLKCSRAHRMLLKCLQLVDGDSGILKK